MCEILLEVSCYKYTFIILVFHLQQPGPQPVIKQHIKAQDLKAGAAGCVIGETRVVVVLEDRVRRDQCLDNHVLDVAPHLVYVVAERLQVLVQGGQLSAGDGYKHEINKGLFGDGW